MKRQVVSMEHLTDEQLVARTVSGEEEAFRMLVRRHQHYIFTLLLGMVGQRETAEDLAQEVFLRLYRSLDRFRGDAKFTTWLYRVAVNIVTDYRRAQRRRPVTALLDRIKRRLAGSGDEQPEQLAVAREERSHLQRAIERLPDKYRLVLYLYHYKQLSYQEVAEVLQLPPKTVETRLYRGKALLKQQWLEVTGNDETAAAKPGTGARFLARPDGVGRIHGAGDGGRSDGSLAHRAQPANRFGLPPDVQNMFIAIAATYLFIVSGVLTRIVTLDERMMATRVNEAVEGLLQVVDALRQTL